MDLATLGVAAGTAAAKKAGESFSAKMMDSLGNVQRRIVNKAVINLRIGFEDYLQTSYTRCRYFKTILNPYEPADLVDSYIGLNLSVATQEQIVSDIDVFKKFWSGDRLVITGLAGSGKSMFMRYLTISSFDNLDVGTPLFVELRKINDYADKDLVKFILSECTPVGRGLTEEQFRLSLVAGLFMLILDGFDELEYEHRDAISKQIISLEKDYPNTKIIVSSRPDDSRFGNWHSFSVFRVCDFSRDQTLKLVETTNTTAVSKRDF